MHWQGHCPHAGERSGELDAGLRDGRAAWQQPLPWRRLHTGTKSPPGDRIPFDGAFADMECALVDCMER